VTACTTGTAVTDETGIPASTTITAGLAGCGGVPTVSASAAGTAGGGRQTRGAVAAHPGGAGITATPTGAAIELIRITVGTGAAVAAGASRATGAVASRCAIRASSVVGRGTSQTGGAPRTAGSAVTAISTGAAGAIVDPEHTSESVAAVTAGTTGSPGPSSTTNSAVTESGGACPAVPASSSDHSCAAVTAITAAGCTRTARGPRHARAASATGAPVAEDQANAGTSGTSGTCGAIGACRAPGATDPAVALNRSAGAAVTAHATGTPDPTVAVKPRRTTVAAGSLVKTCAASTAVTEQQPAHTAVTTDRIEQGAISSVGAISDQELTGDLVDEMVELFTSRTVNPRFDTGVEWLPDGLVKRSRLVQRVDCRRRCRLGGWQRRHARGLGPPRRIQPRTRVHTGWIDRRNGTEGRLEQIDQPIQIRDVSARRRRSNERGHPERDERPRRTRGPYTPSNASLRLIRRTMTTIPGATSHTIPLLRTANCVSADFG
jgi:hypothetical protein